MAGIAAYGRANFAILMGIAVWLCAPPFAAEAAIQISSPDLATALAELARSANVELLFDQSLVAGRMARPVGNASSTEEALDQILSGTGLSYRKTDEGAFVISANEANGVVPTPASSLAIEEILIEGRLTQNVDIPRSEDDVQPYKNADSAEITSSQSTTIQGFLQTRLPSNTQKITAVQDPGPNGGSVRSQIDLRGLSTDQTLILVDGRRLPGVPLGGVFQQSDLNGLSPNAIDRIETLAASTGGIFGIGAAGGVVNVILKREFDGAELSTSNGISQRGDAVHWSVDGRIGYSNSATGTRAMLALGLAEDNELRAGDRDFILKARALRAARSPDVRETVVSPSINFNSVTGAPLTLKQSFGGGSLGATTTFMPVGSPAVTNGGSAILKANAGQYDIRLSPDGQGTLQSLLTPAKTTSVLATVRQDVTPWSEAYVDLLYLRDDGDAIIPALNTAVATISPRAPANPFNEPVAITFPVPNSRGRVATSTVTDRLSAGVILRLGSSWSATFDAATGETIVRSATDVSNANRLVVIDAISGPDLLADELAQSRVVPEARDKVKNHLNDLNLRLGGNLFNLPGGPLSLTATAEFREELNTLVSHQFLGVLQPDTGAVHGRREVTSAFIEARAPLTSSDGAWRPLRSLELQLALRADRYAQKALIFSGSTLEPAETNEDTIVASTYGLRVTPLPGLMLRGSISNGYTPPTPLQLFTYRLAPEVGPFFASGLIDPERANEALTSPFSLSILGSPDLKPQKTVTYSGGAVVRPTAVPGLRLAIDYTQLRTTGEITYFAVGDYQYFIDHEDGLPGRIARAPLSASDMAVGFTGGRITAVDASSLQLGRSVVQTIDFDIDYERDTPLGLFRFYGKAVWEPTFRRWADPAEASYNLVDHPDGPLSWRGNAGIDWQRSNWSSGVNVQFYGGYSGYKGAPPTQVQMVFFGLTDPAKIAGTNASYIPPQFYVDWTLAYHSTLKVLGGREAEVEYRFGIKNLLDAEPPIVAGTLAQQLRNSNLSAYDYNPFGGYSPYGDPIGRRFEFRISSHF